MFKHDNKKLLNFGIVNWLRGEPRSIRSRFFTIPLAKLQYKLTQIRGKTYTEWYAKRMDDNARKTAHTPLSERYLKTASVQLDYLKHKGLLPHHEFLEYGAGVLRAGVHFIAYLEPGKYTACDISRLRLEKGLRLLTSMGLSEKTIRVVTISSAKGTELNDHKFDFILAHDVFCHMPLDEGESCLRALKGNLKPNGKIFLTYSMAERYRTSRIKDFWFTRESFMEMCRRAGWIPQEQDDWVTAYRLPEHPNQVMVMLSHSD